MKWSDSFLHSSFFVVGSRRRTRSPSLYFCSKEFLLYLSFIAFFFSAFLDDAILCAFAKLSISRYLCSFSDLGPLVMVMKVRRLVQGCTLDNIIE